MSKPQDGFVSKILNRPISRLVTKLLLKSPIHPNTWTIAMLLLPLSACLFLMRGNYLGVVIGAAIFQAYSILDGCDGEIARAKNLESEFGKRLDTLCDSVAAVFFVSALGFGLYRFGEGMVCAALISGNELLLLLERREMQISAAALSDSFYARHHGIIAHSGLLNLGEKVVWWIFQLTKRDVAILLFLFLALFRRADWILHLWIAVAGASLILHGIAMIRADTPAGEIESGVPRA